MGDDVVAKQPVKPKKRWWLFGLVGIMAILTATMGMVYFFVIREPPPPPEPAAIALPVEEPKQTKPAPPQLQVDYHFDRNAIVDTRYASGKIVALTSAGNPLIFDATTFELIKEKVFARKTTCLGPVEQQHVLLGLANGALVRMSTLDFTIESLGIVPGVPLKIEQSQDTILVVYRPFRNHQSNRLVLEDLSLHHKQFVPENIVLLVDYKGRVWISDSEHIWILDLATGKKRDVPWREGLGKVLGLCELMHHQVWAYGGSTQGGAFIVQLDSDTKTGLIYASTLGKEPQGPKTAIESIVEDPNHGALVVLTKDGIYSANRTLSAWKEYDFSLDQEGPNKTFGPKGQVHLHDERLIYALAYGGLAEVTPDRFQRHTLKNQLSLPGPLEISRLGTGMVFAGAGSPQYWDGKFWQPLPEAVTPPAELLWGSRSKKNERSWAKIMTIPTWGEHCYIIAKAGPVQSDGRASQGNIEMVVTARWDGDVLTVLGREDLSIEPANTFITPDRQIWNVNEKGLWNFSGGRWRVAMRTEEARRLRRVSENDHETRYSPLGKPLHFVERTGLPFYATPRLTPSYSLIRMDVTPMGDVPLFDDVAVKIGNRRSLIHDAILWGNTKEHLLLATDHGLCVYNVRFASCERIFPEGITDEVTLFKRDGTRRLWIGGKGLWVLRDNQTAEAIHPWLPMLADTRVRSLAETVDGRLVIGLDERGVVFVNIPPGWFMRPETQPNIEDWEATLPSEPIYTDPTVLLQFCDHRNEWTGEALEKFLQDLSIQVFQLDPRARIELEANYDGMNDIAVRGPSLEPLFNTVLAAIERSARNQFAVYRRFGAKGSLKVESQGCR